MSTVEGLAAVAATAIVAVVAGGLVCRAWGASGRTTVIAAAPTTFALVATFSYVQPLTHAPLTLLGLLVLLVGAALVGLGVRMVGHRVMRRRGARPPRRTPGTTGRDRGGVVLALLLLGTTLVAATVLLVATDGDLGMPSQTFDSLNHLNLVRHVVETGLSNPWDINDFFTDRPTGFYPSGFASVASAVALLLRTDPAVACNVAAVLLAGVLWPSTVMLLSRLVLHRSTAVTCAVGALSLTVWGMPWAPMGWGVLWPTATAAAFVPLVLAGLVVALGEGAGGASRPQGLVLLVIGLLATGMFHPRGLLIAVPVLLVYVVTWLVRRAPGVRGRWWLTALVATALTLGVLVGGSVAVNGVVGGRISSIAWPVRETVPTAIVAKLVGGGDHVVPSLVTAALVLLGLVRAARRPRLLWLLPATVVLMALDVATASTHSELVDQVTRFWYSDRYRSATMLPPVSLLCAGLAVQGLLGARTRRRDAGRHRSGDRPRTMPHLAVAGVTAAAVVLGSVSSAGYLTRWYSHLALDPDHGLASPAEVVAYREIGRIVPRRDVVLNSPLDGSALLYALGGTQVAYYAFPTPGTRYANALRASLVVDPDHARVCERLQHDGIRWVVNGGRTYNTWVTGSTDAPTMTIPTGGFWLTTLRYESGGVSLYEVTGCP